MSGEGAMRKPLYLRTPLIQSPILSKRAGFDVYLKLENTQPCHSFKLRGISHLCQQLKEKEGCRHIISSSGGNAGLAAAYSARMLKISATIIVPDTTPLSMRERLQLEGAAVEVHGSVWNEADQRARQLAQQPGYGYVPPFDNPLIWEGNASMMREVKEDLPVRPDVVVTVCGGGGLMIGIVQGLQQAGWGDVPLLVMETQGAESLNASIVAGELVTLPAITSVAKSLGALRVSEQAIACCKTHPVLSEVVTDQEAVAACLQFTDDHKMLVEPSCGAGLTAVYSGVIGKLVREGRLGTVRTAVIVVCGGGIATLELLQKWKTDVGL